MRQKELLWQDFAKMITKTRCLDKRFNISTKNLGKKTNTVLVNIISKTNLTLFQAAYNKSKSKWYKRNLFYYRFQIWKNNKYFQPIDSKVIKLSNSKYRMECAIDLGDCTNKTYLLLVLKSNKKIFPVFEKHFFFKRKGNKRHDIKQTKKLSLLQKLKFLCLKRSRTYYLNNLDDIYSSRMTADEYLYNEILFKQFNLVLKQDKISNESLCYNIYRGAGAIGKTRFIVKGKNCSIEHIKNLSTLKKYFLQEELLQFCLLKNFTKIHLKIETSRRLSGTWLTMLHNASENWLHWITEVLPRIYADIDYIKTIDGIIVDSDLPQNMYKTLTMSGLNCEILKIPKNQLVLSDRLVVPKKCSYSLFWPRSKDNILNGLHEFDDQALKNMRKKINSNSSPRTQRGKVYLKRKSFFRIIVNETEVHNLLKRKDYVTITPDEKNLKTIIREFAKASDFILQAGAAFGNAVFANAGSTFRLMCLDYKGIDIDYMKKIGKIFGHKTTFIKCDFDNVRKYNERDIYSTHHPMNANMVVDINKLNKTLK